MSEELKNELNCNGNTANQNIVLFSCEAMGMAVFISWLMLFNCILASILEIALYGSGAFFAIFSAIIMIPVIIFSCLSKRGIAIAGMALVGFLTFIEFCVNIYNIIHNDSNYVVLILIMPFLACVYIVMVAKCEKLSLTEKYIVYTTLFGVNKIPIEKISFFKSGIFSSIKVSSAGGTIFAMGVKNRNGFYSILSSLIDKRVI